MTAEERAGKFFDDWNAGVFHHDDVPSVLTVAIREAEAAAAAGQREADAAVCRAVLDFWASDSPAPDPYEAGAVAAAEMCAERIMEGCPDAGGGGAGGAT